MESLKEQEELDEFFDLIDTSPVQKNIFGSFNDPIKVKLFNKKSKKKDKFGGSFMYVPYIPNVKFPKIKNVSKLSLNEQLDRHYENKNK